MKAFIEQGFERTTIEQIRDSSGASHGSIYHHFGSKEAIALALYVEGMEDYHTGMQAVVEKPTTAEGIIRAMIRYHLEWTAADPSRSLYLTRAGMAEAGGATAEQIAAVNHDFFEAVHNWLRPFIDRGEILRLPAEMYASLVIGPASHCARHWLAGRLSIDLIEAAQPLADAAWRSLHKPAKKVGSGSD